MASEQIILIAVLVSAYVVGLFNALHAVMQVRSPQSAIAWSISLITFPLIAIPLYWIFGKSRFRGYITPYSRSYTRYQQLISPAYASIAKCAVTPAPPFDSLAHLAQQLVGLPFMTGNNTRLLIDGQQTYSAMLEAINRAERYILLQSYILRSDRIGNTFREILIQKAQQGVRVYLLYDAIGSQKLSKRYLQDLYQQGVQVVAFRSSKGFTYRFQLNFRNHRKILVVDGQVGFMGGVNIGDEYFGRDPQLGNWRDTHFQIQGPAVQCLQLSFLADWHWATGTIPATEWMEQAPATHTETLLVFPTGPADILPNATLLVGHLIHLAEKRLWIASPYFVPDEPTLTALKRAALRGVDVRILLPEKADHLIVYLCAFSYYPEMQAAGIKLYRYQKDFMHQKVMLVDDVIATIGTLNLDNRSFHLNFEVTAFVTQSQKVAAIEEMLTMDFEHSRLVDFADYDQRTLPFKAAVKIARLFAPLQ
jgi:cardiolipin synthase A/B